MYHLFQSNRCVRIGEILVNHYRSVIDAFGTRILTLDAKQSRFESIIQQYILVYGSQTSYYLQFPNSEKQNNYRSGLKNHFLLLLVILIIEIILGTEIRGGLEMIRKENPIIDKIIFLITSIKYFKINFTRSKKFC